MRGVLVIGAGPTGLTLALALRRRGLPCRLVDQAPEPSAAADLLVPLRLRHGEGELALLSTVTAFGTALDVTIEELSIEAFYPADAATAAALTRAAA